LLIVGFWSMELEDPRTGKSSTLLIDGQFVYLGVVMLVNIKIISSTSNYTFYSYFFVIGCILTFVLAYYLLNLFESQNLYSLFYFPYMHLITYVALIFISAALILIDNGMHLVQYEF